MTTDLFAALHADFVADASERLDRVEEVLLDLADVESAEREKRLNVAKRELHTIKGNAGMMGLDELQAAAHEMEDGIVDLAVGGEETALLEQLDEFRHTVATLTNGEGNAAGTDTTRSEGVVSVRIPFSTLDPLIDLVGEMVLHRNHLANGVRVGRTEARTTVGTAARAAWSGVEEAQESLGRTLDVIQERILRLRMTPLHMLFRSLRRVVHDESRRSGRSAQLVTEGGDTPLDRALLELAQEALGHLVRNAVAHGLESPGDREAAGKPTMGTVRLTATTRSEEVHIEVVDDGGGIDPDVISRQANDRGFDVDPSNPYGVLFEPGFTTRAAADMGSGRGVGLSAVREAVQRQGGEISVDSTPGAGTRFLLKLPLSVSITQALVVSADDERYAVPLTGVVESFRLRPDAVHEVNRANVLVWREAALAAVDLGLLFGTRTEPSRKGHALVVEAGGKRRGLIIDGLHGVEEIVVKTLDPVVGHPRGVSGSTILGDGCPILILDPRQLVEVEPFVRNAA